MEKLLSKGHLKKKVNKKMLLSNIQEFVYRSGVVLEILFGEKNDFKIEGYLLKNLVVNLKGNKKSNG